MPSVISIGLYKPPHEISQQETVEFARELFHDSYHDIDRLLKVFSNGQIKKRNFTESLGWLKQDRSFEEKNNVYIERSITFGIEAIKSCLSDSVYLKRPVDYKQIDAIFFISTTGLSTPSIEAKIMNRLPFSPHTKRIPIWGLGCAGGASGLSRAFEYCKAFPESKVLVLTVELCSLTFQQDDHSKSNLIGTSLFADGVACACVAGNDADLSNCKLETIPEIIDTQSTLMPDSEDVMGWNVKNSGLHVVFSKDIPSIIESWLKDNVYFFLKKQQLNLRDISHFIAHPGGKKVIQAYEKALGFSEEMTRVSHTVLQNHGNMSSATLLYVLAEFMKSSKVSKGDFGLAAALGPGFSSELLLIKWR
ncbi:type III polyketide synthase [Litchfieldia salsa]|uniref:15-methylpalmitoyl-4-hydroxy-2-pyrone synthase n=1 Tax=Litchfieldia salsa TaxID=930152 RepID=A0A1H0THW2_9BACI|nr:3-oxoacyl-[acyl-carrier-protein] synthase III C-terminal domain-containing protein [Litchfieldia salsa]SDP53627.1 15-methylpalmitoyl-4-hydroxy-2-pyrone synthase [Litchfieldia salsa]